MPDLECESALTYQKVYSPSLEGNLLGDSPRRDVVVFLPPSYYSRPERRFPVVYLLHGYNGTSGMWVSGPSGFNIQAAMEALIQAGNASEMILVMPDARNEYGGSYYTNSTVTGNWEDFIVDDLVKYVDSNYRTIATRESRGIYGHSMGGYGSIRIGMKHSNIFGVCYGTSPACLDFVGDIADPETWRSTLRIKNREELGMLPQSGKRWRGNYPNALIGFAAAVSPEATKKPLLVELPFELVGESVRAVDRVRERWLSHCPARMVGEYATALRGTCGLRITVGIHDHLTHIPLGGLALSRALKQHNVPHVFDEVDGDHASSFRQWMEAFVLPYFSEQFSS